MHKKPAIAGGVVIQKKSGRVLIVNQHGNSWSLPKGHGDDGEEALTAAKREIAEESGISVLEYVKTLPPYERYRISLTGGDDVSELKTLQMFLFLTEEETLAPRDPENPEARWVPVKEVSALLTHAKDREFFESIIPEIKKVC